MVIGMTGGSGYLGTHCRQYLEQLGHEFVSFQPARSAPPETGRHVVCELGEPLEAAAFEGLDLLIHGAYDHRPRTLSASSAVNVDGTVALLLAAAEAAVPRQVVISSMSAFDGCVSRYGLTKLRLEAAVRESGAWVIRPGLVWGGAGGLLHTMAKLTRKLPVVPVFGGGRQVLYLNHYEDLAGFFLRVGSGEPGECPEPFVLAHPEPWPMIRILSRLAGVQGRRVRFLSVPWRPMYHVMAAVEKCGATLPFRSDSLLSLMNQHPAPDFAPQEELGMELRPFDPADEPALR